MYSTTDWLKEELQRKEREEKKQHRKVESERREREERKAEEDRRLSSVASFKILGQRLKEIKEKRRREEEELKQQEEIERALKDKKEKLRRWI